MNPLVARLPTDGSFVHAIECVAQGTRVALPADSIERIVEYDVSPLPLAGPYVAGLAQHDACVIVSVRLSREGASSGTRRAKAALVAGASSARTRWAVEVDEVISLVHVKAADAGRSTLAAGAPSWLAAALTADGREVHCVDVESMLRAFGVAA
jgi:hypothetical protein